MAKTTQKWSLNVADEAALLDCLVQMENDTQYNTQSRYITNTEKYPDNTITFSQIHLEHLKKYPSVDPYQYLSNLKLMTKIR